MKKEKFRQTRCAMPYNNCGSHEKASSNPPWLVCPWERTLIRLVCFHCAADWSGRAGRASVLSTLEAERAQSFCIRTTHHAFGWEVQGEVSGRRLTAENIFRPWTTSWPVWR